MGIEVIINIQFTEEDMEMIFMYQEACGATDVKNAIMNAISICLDHADDQG